MKKAITLIELLIVMVIMAVVGGAIIGRMLSGIERGRLQAAGRQVISHIRLAQERAKLEQRNISVEFDAGNEIYKIYQAGGSFDGVDDYVGTVNDLSWSSAQSFTLSLWIKPTNVSGNQPLISKVNWEYTLMQTSSSVQFIYWNTGGGHAIDITASNVLTAGQWTHIVFTFNGGINSAVMYINGVQSTSGSSAGSHQDRTEATKIGTGYVWATGYFNGTISEVRIYNRALTAGEISYSYTYKKPQNRAGLVGWWRLDEGRGTTAADASGNNNTGTITGATWTQGVLSYLKDPAKNYQDINYNFNNLAEFKGVLVSSANFDGSTDPVRFAFDSLGRPKVGTANLSANGTVVLTCGSHALTITVNKATGEATMQ